MIDEKKLDQFYTVPYIAKKCYEICLEQLNELNIPQVRWLEPSAGKGAFFNLINGEKIGIDLDPKCRDVISADFLEYQLPYKDYITLGNPPFGKNSSLAIKFFNKCAEHSLAVCFILPKTFKKNSVIKKLEKNMHLVFEWDLPENSFSSNDEIVDVPCVFQIWMKKEDLRIDKKPVFKVDDLSFVHRDLADIAFQRVGVNAGAIKSRDLFDKIADASHIFIKLNNSNALNILKSINWDHIKFNTAGNPSISKSELIEEYIKNKKV